MRRLLALGAIIGGVVVAWRRGTGRSGPGRLPGATVKQRIMAQMMERLPPDSPPKLVMSILPQLRQQNDEIIALLREQNELLRRGRSPSVGTERESHQ